MQPPVEIRRQIGVIVAKRPGHLLQRQRAGVVFLHVVDDTCLQRVIRALPGPRAEGTLLQRRAANQIQPRQLFTAVVAGPQQLHQGRGLHAEHRVFKRTLAQLRLKIRHPIVGKYPQHTLGALLGRIAVYLVGQHQQCLPGVNIIRICFQCAGQRSGLHAQKFIAVVQMRRKVEIVVALAVEVFQLLGALGLINQQCGHFLAGGKVQTYVYYFTHSFLPVQGGNR